MTSKKNPLNLNALQLRTLTLMQALARLDAFAAPAQEPGHVLISAMPHAHGDHFHVGDAVVAARDATGLYNEAVWTVLQRKGLIRSLFPQAAIVTPEGLAYETGLADQILHRHHGH